MKELNFEVVNKVKLVFFRGLFHGGNKSNFVLPMSLLIIFIN